MTDHNAHDQLEAYALGVLDGDQLTAFEAHLVDCTSCQSVLADYQEILANLPITLAEKTDATVPPRIKTQLRAELARSANTSDNIATNRRYRPTLDQTTLRWLRWGFAAVFILLALVSFWIIRLQTALAEEQALNDQLIQETELIFEIVDAEDNTRLFLSPQSDNRRPGGAPPYGKVFVRPDMPYVIAMGGRLPEPPSGDVYHLWLFNEKQAQLAGELIVNDVGFASLIYEADRNGLVFHKALVIAQEPDATTPDGEVLLSYTSDS